MTSYQPGIPTGSVDLDEDYQNLQNNFQSLDTYFGIDHTQYSVNNLTTPSGYHKSVHMIPQSSPSVTAGFGQLYSQTIDDGVNNDQTLFWLTGGNRTIQLTRNFQPVAATNGYTMLPGGLIMQWGIVSIPSGTVTFSTNNIAFPSACFSVQLTLISKASSTSSSNNSLFIDTATSSRTQFKWRYNGGSGDFQSFYWVAIGN
jgi:hypothetical protein